LLVLTESMLQQAIALGAAELVGNDFDFYRRVWSTDLDIYRVRLSRLGFSRMTRVLDAGAGFGQWTMCLSESNQHVVAVDASPTRVKAVRAIAEALGLTNVTVARQSLESLDFPDNAFDCIFCYSVLYLTDYRKTVREFARVLQPGGRLYICSNGWGWYIYNLIRKHNPSHLFNPRTMAASTIAHTFTFAITGNKQPERQLIVSGRHLRKYLENNRFEAVTLGGEGTLPLSADENVRRFYASHYLGLECVYEILAQRKQEV
jgi:SAM-dependent methyltransferase